MFFNDKLFSKSVLSGFLTFVFSIILANILQFLLFVDLADNIRTDLTVLTTFIISVLFNFYIHNKYIFLTKFRFLKLINFYIANLLNLVVPIFFWFVYELIFGNPTMIMFNLFAVFLTVLLFPIKYLMYRFIFKN